MNILRNSYFYIYLIYRTLYASLSLFCGVGIAFLLEIVLHKGSNVEFELPVTSEDELSKDVHGSNRKGIWHDID